MRVHHRQRYVGLLCAATAIIGSACHRARPVTFVQGGEPLRRPDGFACVAGDSVARPAADAFRSARTALRDMGVTPMVSDSVERRLVVAGSSAPRVRGSGRLRLAQLFLQVDVRPINDTSSWYSIAPGVYYEPRGLSPEQRDELYQEAEDLGKSLVSRARLGKSCERVSAMSRGGRSD